MIKEKIINTNKETSINIIQTKIESIRKRNITTTGYRVYHNNYIGVAGALGSHDEKEFEARAVKALELKIPYSHKVTSNRNLHEDYRNDLLTEEQFVQEIDELLKELRCRCSDFIFSSNIKMSEEYVELINSENLNLSYKDKALKIELGVKHKSSIAIIDFSIDIISREYNKDEIIQYIEEICNGYNNMVDLSLEGKVPVVFLESEYLLYLKLWQELNGMKFGTGASLLSKSIGEKIFNEEFTLYQRATKNEILVPFFDVEGIINEGYEVSLIDKGVMVSPYTSKKIAETYNLPLTGAASCAYDEVPNLGIPSLAIKPSNKTCKELLKGEMGILVVIASGGDYTPEGVFGTPVQMAMLFDGEKIIGRLPEIQLSSDLFSMYGKDFRGVSKNTINKISNTRYVVMDLEIRKL